ncbi:TLD-domain containing nucleolar protein [Wolffia australiana]
MGQKKPSLRSKAAHLVSDITTVLLNPVSDAPSSPRGAEAAKTNLEEQVPETESKSLVEPDTSSFTAFLSSLLSSAESSDHFSIRSEDHPVRTLEAAASSSAIGENPGRKSLLSRGKQSLGKAFQKASRIVSFRDKKSFSKSNSDLTKLSVPSSNEPTESVHQANLPVISDTSLLISGSLREDLYGIFPALVQGKCWVLLYSTWKHGISLSTLYRRSALCPGFCLLVVGDRKGAVFGGLLEAPLHPSSKRKYQGTNNTFIFTTQSSPPSIFRPTGANRYFSLCSPEFLAIGGGGHFALYLDEDLLNGSSATSETFGNSCLATSEDFEVKEVELWGFVCASKYEETLSICGPKDAEGICHW